MSESPYSILPGMFRSDVMEYRDIAVSFETGQRGTRAPCRHSNSYLLPKLLVNLQTESLLHRASLFLVCLLVHPFTRLNI